ncbi:23S rRNA (uridine2552-2'-O)-methyltransferase [Paucidesulfovibrio gracilis DSM 16080]|uniref:Ribosomal RNA large subunit methyltransferase E n=1 Tax=Paucidesulfovibrio gracilis DSM 16080 TaxID=1121449 RepID=A0A1T4W9W6_9BACT|nr:RlmE family RNA methyltransferase [Paucidesulfovibrio gracilis]SKA74076.1 23S rRNA (uridine2552-2'-O)-methyltransferase [Paucidesulfovibrio gracilis DSM 16080]
MKKYQDHYFKRAKQENYPARSVYKLQEIEKRFNIFRSGQRVLDLGAAPGSWSLFAARKVGGKGHVLGVDLQTTETEFPDNVEFFHGDAFEQDGPFADRRAELAPFDLVISDMAPKTTGVKFADQARSLELCELARDVLPGVLVTGGHFVAKIFEGPDVKAYTDSLRPLFEKVKTFKPKSSRAESKEMFVVGLGFRGDAL